MPTYRSINVSLHSQFDIETFPEYIPHPPEYYAERGAAGIVQPFVDKNTSTCSVYIPVFPGSQFWISYAVFPPVPDNQEFFFKFFINGSHVVSWSTGKAEEWKGKTVFGLFERVDDAGKKKIEKRMLCFTPPNRKDGQWKDVTNAFDENAYMEIRVYRAHGKKRMERKVENYSETEHGRSRQGIDAGSDHPKRLYQFALVDPIDKPFAQFRYYYRTWEQLGLLGLPHDETSDSEDTTEMSVMEPYDPADEARQPAEEVNEEQQPGDVFQPTHDGIDDRPHTSPHAYVSMGTANPGSGSGSRSDKSNASSDDHTRRRYSGESNSPNALSMPPSCRFEPPRPPSRPLPSIPSKIDSAVDTSYQPHPVYPVEDWVVRTPSPVKSVRDGITTPPLFRRRGIFTTGMLKAIATTWKRRGTPSSERSDDAGSRSASRSVS